MRKEAFTTLRLAIPIIIGELAQMALHLIDSAMVGSVGYKYLAASALVINAMGIPFVIGIGMTISVSQMVSLSHGKNSDADVSHYLFNGFVLCTLTAVIISSVLIFFRGAMKHMGQDAEVVQLALPFMQLMGFSIVPMLLFMTLKQFSDGLQLTKTAMVLSIAGLPLNAFLAWLLIYGHWGFPRLLLNGAGWATLITRWAMVAVLAVIVLRHKAYQPYVSLRHTEWKLRAKTLQSLLRIGVPSALQIGMEAGAFAVSGILIGTISAVAQAAHQIALSCASFTFMVSMGLAQATSIRVSNALGRQEWANIGRIGKSSLVTSLLYGGFCATGFATLRFVLPHLFTTNQNVLELSATLLLFAALFQISDSTQAIGAGLLRGVKDVKTPTVLVGVAYWVIGIPVGWWLAFKVGLGAKGMWLGLIIGLTLASGFLMRRFFILVKLRA